MPLVAATLKSQLEALFTEPPATESECAGRWASAIEAYALAIIPASTTVSSAAASLRGSLTGFNGESALASTLATALSSFAGTVAGGMQPAFTGVPPTSSLSLSFSNHDTAGAAAQAIADAVHTWMITGTATNNTTAATLSWS